RGRALAAAPPTPSNASRARCVPYAHAARARTIERGIVRGLDRAARVRPDCEAENGSRRRFAAMSEWGYSRTATRGTRLVMLAARARPSDDRLDVDRLRGRRSTLHRRARARAPERAPGRRLGSPL